MVVVSHGVSDTLRGLAMLEGKERAEEVLEELEGCWDTGQQRLARSLASESCIIRGKGVGHFMPQRSPDMVASVVGGVVAAVRSPDDCKSILATLKKNFHTPYMQF